VNKIVDTGACFDGDVSWQNVVFHGALGEREGSRKGRSEWGGLGGRESAAEGEWKELPVQRLMKRVRQEMGKMVANYEKGTAWPLGRDIVWKCKAGTLVHIERAKKKREEACKKCQDAIEFPPVTHLDIHGYRRVQSQGLGDDCLSVRQMLHLLILRLACSDNLSHLSTKAARVSVRKLDGQIGKTPPRVPLQPFCPRHHDDGTTPTTHCLAGEKQ
jgi:hypothetical protein